MSPYRIVHLNLVLPVMAIAAVGQGEVSERQLASLIRSLRVGESPAIEELVRVGKPAVPALLEVVQSARPPARYRAIEVLGRMGPGASDVVDELLEAAPNLGGTELPFLIRAVGNLLPYRESGIPDLETKLTPLILTAYTSVSGEAQESVLMTADRTLSRFGLNADTSVEDLTRALGDSNSYVRELAAELLGYRGADSKSALRALDEAAGNFRHPEVPVWDDRTVDYSAEVQHSAANAVLAIATDEVLSIGRAHAIRLRVGTRTERVDSARALASMASRVAADPVLCSEVVFHLVESIAEDHTSASAREAVVALGEVGKSLESWTAARYWATTAVPLLQVLAGSRDKELAERAKAALDR